MIERHKNNNEKFAIHIHFFTSAVYSVEQKKSFLLLFFQREDFRGLNGGFSSLLLLPREPGLAKGEGILVGCRWGKRDYSGKFRFLRTGEKNGVLSETDRVIF